MHYVQTRIATIDTYAVFFILLMYLFMYLWCEDGKKRYLALSGLFFGIGAASKWTCIYAGAGLAVIWALHWIVRAYHRKDEENGGNLFAEFLRNCGFCVVFFVLVPAAIYYVSYYHYGAAKGLTGHRRVLHQGVCADRSGQPNLYVHLPLRRHGLASVLVALVPVGARYPTDTILSGLRHGRHAAELRCVREPDTVLGGAYRALCAGL